MASPTTSAAPSGTTAGASPECTTAVPGKYGNVPFDACNSYYNFDPQFAPAVAVAVLFGLLMITHIVEAIIYKKRYAWVLIMGASWETFSFILHALGSRSQQNMGYSIGHTLLFLLAPLWINAFAYMTLARMVHLLIPGRRLLGVPSTVVGKMFVWADVATFMVQAAGGSMLSGDDDHVAQLGLKIYMIGMGLQEGAILGFVGLMVAFQLKMRALEAGGGGDVEAAVTAEGERLVEQPASSRRWKGVLYGMYVVLAAITMRIVYRIVEFAGGMTPSNPIPFNEVYSYTLDAAPMMAALLVLAIWHPGRVLQGPHSDFRLVRAERKAAKVAKKEEKRQRKDERRQEKEQRRAGKKAAKSGRFEDVELGSRDRSPTASE